MSDSEKDGGKRSRWKKHGRKVVIVLGVTVLLFVGWRVWASYRVNAKLAALRAAGYPTSLAELERKYYPKITSGENGADYYVNIFSQMTNVVGPSWPESGSWGLVGDFAESISPDDRERILLVLSDNSTLLNLLRSAPRNGKYRYPINLADGYDALTPHVHKIMTCSRLLLGDAGLKCQDRQIEDAITDIDAAFRLAQSLADEPVLSSQLARLSLNVRAVSAVENIVCHGHFTESQLIRVGDMCRSNRPTGGLERGMTGELCVAIELFQKSGKKRADTVLYFDPDKESELGRTLFWGGISFLGITSLDYRFCLDIMTERLRISKLPYPQNLDALEKLNGRFEAGRHFIHFYAIEISLGLGRIHEREGWVLALFDMTMTGVAIERFRIANDGRLPTKLEELVPAYLAGVPMDPFDGKPIRYKTLEKGYMVYSIGDDRKDDGGVARDTKKGQMGEDIVFRVGR